MLPTTRASVMTGAFVRRFGPTSTSPVSFAVAPSPRRSIARPPVVSTLFFSSSAPVLPGAAVPSITTMPLPCTARIRLYWTKTSLAPFATSTPVPSVCAAPSEVPAIQLPSTKTRLPPSITTPMLSIAAAPPMLFASTNGVLELEPTRALRAARSRTPCPPGSAMSPSGATLMRLPETRFSSVKFEPAAGLVDEHGRRVARDDVAVVGELRAADDVADRRGAAADADAERRQRTRHGEVRRDADEVAAHAMVRAGEVDLCVGEAVDRDAADVRRGCR